MCQPAQLVQGRLEVASEPIEQRAGLSRVVLEDRAGEPDPHRHRDQVLLGAVVEITLDPTPGLVGGRHDPGSGCLELGVAPAQLLEGRLKGSVQSDVVQRETGMAGQLGKAGLLCLAEHPRARGAAYDQQPEQVAEVADRGHPDDLVLATLQQSRRPYRYPGVAADPCPRDDSLLLDAELEPLGGETGHGDGTYERLIGGDPDLGTGGRTGGVQALGQLEQQLVHRHRAGHPGGQVVKSLLGAY